MIEQKFFYKKLDAIIRNIVHDKTSEENLLVSIIRGLEDVFGKAFNFANCRIYEKEDGGYVLIYSTQKKNDTGLSKRIPASSKALQTVLKKSIYIFSKPHEALELRFESEQNNIVTVAFAIEGNQESRIVVLDLTSGWIREEIEFYVNAVRVAISFRLYSEMMQNNLQQAANIQKSLLPENPPEFEDYEIALRSEPSEFIIGDLYDFYRFDDKYFGLCIGDATGHGLPAALLVRDVITGLRMGLESGLKTIYTLEKLNGVIHRSTFSTRFVSLCYGEVEDDGHLIYINAGHPPPILVSGKHVKELQATGTILGALDTISLHRGYARIDPGDILILYSDGVIERLNRTGEQFGIARLKKVALAYREESAQYLLDTIFKAVNDFGMRETWDDDTTVIVLKRTANHNK